MKYFPMFVNLEKKKVTVIGGGTIATRRVETLLEFGCSIIVIAPSISDTLKNYQEKGFLLWKAREYKELDCQDNYFILAATDERQVNHQIYLDAKVHGILVNVCDKKEECDFYFPGVITSEEVVIGITSSGTDHKLVKELKERIESNIKLF